MCRTLAVMHGNFNFKFVREILYSPPMQPREQHIVIKNACRNIHATRKNLTQADRMHTNVSI